MTSSGAKKVIDNFDLLREADVAMGVISIRNGANVTSKSLPVNHSLPPNVAEMVEEEEMNH